MVISARLNVTQASRHCMIDLCFTHLFSNSYDINNNISEITQILHTYHFDVITILIIWHQDYRKEKEESKETMPLEVVTDGKKYKTE